ncbi:hypothetical protein J4216_06100, partial [Candidatus Woesearchaeota archaeon]|nr:hypothetical protein [Candidatus Woesearchaeota archaeon]
TINNLLGKSDSINKTIGKKAYKLRADTDQVLYNVYEILSNLINKKIPENLIDYKSFLKYEEIISNKYPEIEELKKREKGFIYWKGKLYLGTDISKFEDTKNIILEEDQGENKIKLEKVYSRAHSLFYLHIWSNSDFNVFNIKNLLFLKEKDSQIVSVWYNQEELNSLLKGIVEKLNSNSKYFESTKKNFEKYLKILVANYGSYYSYS